MQVDGMSCQGCVNTVTKTIQGLDPGAEWPWTLTMAGSG